MVFMYAGLGIAMISGIAAMMEVANNVSRFNVISGIKEDKYIIANLARYDRRFLRFINDPAAPKSDICKYIIDQTDIERSSLLNIGATVKELDIVAPLYLDRPNINEPIFSTLSIDKRVSGSCVLINTSLKHRVLINKNNSNNRVYDYSLFSCYLVDKSYCDFEENK